MPFIPSAALLQQAATPVSPGAPAVSGQAYHPAVFQNASAGDQTQSRLYAMRIALRAGTLDRIAAEHWTGSTSGETFRMGIYSPDANGMPGSLLLDAGTIDLSTATGFKAITISQAVTDGWYWLVGVQQGGTAAGMLSVGYGSVQAAGWATTFNQLKDFTAVYQNNAQYLYVGAVTGALPGSFGAWSYGADSNCPYIVVRYA